MGSDEPVEGGTAPSVVRPQVDRLPEQLSGPEATEETSSFVSSDGVCLADGGNTTPFPGPADDLEASTASVSLGASMPYV